MTLRRRQNSQSPPSRRGVSRKDVHRSSSSRLALFAEPDVLLDVAWCPELNSSPRRPSLNRRRTTWHNIENSADRGGSGGNGGASAAPAPGSLRRHSIPSKLLHEAEVRRTRKLLLEPLDEVNETTDGEAASRGVPQSKVEPRKRDEGEESSSSAQPAVASAVGGSAAALLFLGIVASSSLSNLTLQKLNALRPGCGQLITLLQYVATCLEKSPRAGTYLLRPCIPPPYHLAFVLLMFLTAWASNKSMESGMPFGHFLVVKNTNLVFSMLLGFGMLGRRYTAVQVSGVVAVTVGVVVCVLAAQDDDGAGGEEEERRSSAMVAGALLCACSTLSVSALGCLQEKAFRVYGDLDMDSNPADEVLFTMHLLGLPFFFLGSGTASLTSHLSALFRSPSSPLSSLALLVANVGTTAMLKRCFVGLLGMGGALTATMAVTVSRTLGVVISEMMEKDEDGPGIMFWSGAGAVALGSIAYVLGGKGGNKSDEKKKEV